MKQFSLEITAFSDTLMKALNPSPKVKSVFVKTARVFKRLEVRWAGKKKDEHAGAVVGAVPTV